MTTSTFRIAAVAALALSLGVTVMAKTKFSSVWKSPDAVAGGFQGKKVAALFIDTDDSLRVSAEESLTRELAGRGVNGVPSYRLVPKEVLKDAQEAKGFFERGGIEGVVALRVVNDDRRTYYKPATWSSAYYSTLWGYYGYGVAAVYDPGFKRDERIVSMEVLIYSVPKNALVWAGLATIENPKNPQKTAEEIVKEAVKEMRKQGLVR